MLAPDGRRARIRGAHVVVVAGVARLGDVDQGVRASGRLVTGVDGAQVGIRAVDGRAGRTFAVEARRRGRALVGGRTLWIGEPIVLLAVKARVAVLTLGSGGFLASLRRVA